VPVQYPDLGLTDSEHLLMVHPLMILCREKLLMWSEVRDLLIYNAGRIGMSIDAMNRMLPEAEFYYKAGIY